MLDRLTYDLMEPQTGTTFTVRLDSGETVPLVLTKVGKVMESEAARLNRNPFSLYFSGPLQPFLPQHTYDLAHETFGPDPLPLFLVPVARGADAYVYEAVFT